MPIRCPICGFDNRDTAKFCSSCGQHRLALGGSDVAAPPQATPLHVRSDSSAAAPLVSRVSTSIVPIGVPTRSSPPESTRVPALLTGSVETYNEIEVYPPSNPAWALTKAGLLVAALPVVLSFVAGLSLVLVVLVLFGGMLVLGIIAIVGKVFGLVGLVLRLLLPARRPADRRTTQVSLGIEDTQRTLHRVVLHGDQIGGLLRQGDIVAVYGRHHRTGWIRAHRVVILGRQLATGSVQPVTIKGRRALPPPIVPIVIWIAAVGMWLWLFSPLLLDRLNLR